MNRNEKNVNKLTMLGMMTALVFVSNYLRLAAGACGRFCLRLGFRHL